MKWVSDRTGRFVRRPHYLPAELDGECETLITNFLHERRGTVEYPISTNDLTVLIETLVADLDLYADLSSEDGEVEGVTDFFPGRLPKVRIAQQLTTNPRMENRLRTTLTHELAHVKFHTFLFDGPVSGSLFQDSGHGQSNMCKRETILEARQTDWMEWQAGFCCGGFLMPATMLQQVVREFRAHFGLPVGTMALDSADSQCLIKGVSEHFAVSRDAARVRLQQQGVLTAAAVANAPQLFS
jgi:hypothetical protein